MNISLTEKSCSGEILINEVVNKGLCLSCGLCAAICKDNALEISDLTGKCQPQVNKSKCSDCGNCLKVCPGKEVDVFSLQKYVFSEKILQLTGKFRKSGVSYSTDDNIRYNSSSGGVVTSILKYLLRTKEVDHVICLGFNKEKPYLTEYKDVTNENEIELHSQSKYAVNHLGDILKDLKGKIAVVTLPCHTHGLRKWQMLKANYPEIKYILGLYCGNNLYFSATRDLLKRLGIKNFSDIKEMHYRQGNWPGNFQVKTNSGIVREISKDTFNYLSFIHTIPRCHFCFDLTNEFADLSFGDAWKFENTHNKGYTLTLARTREGEDLINRVIKDNCIKFDSADYEEIIKMHAHLLKRKKIGAFKRMKTAEKTGLSIPRYNVTFQGNTSFFEYLSLVLINRNVINIMFSLIPLFLIGIFMKLLRKLWKILSFTKIPLTWNVEETHE